MLSEVAAAEWVVAVVVVVVVVVVLLLSSTPSSGCMSKKPKPKTVEFIEFIDTIELLRREEECRRSEREEAEVVCDLLRLEASACTIVVLLAAAAFRPHLRSFRQELFGTAVAVVGGGEVWLAIFPILKRVYTVCVLRRC